MAVRNNAGLFRRRFLPQGSRTTDRLVAPRHGCERRRDSFADGKTLRPSSIIWATGYDADYSWIDLPICDASGRPNLSRQAIAAPGLYFIGLWNQRSLASALIFGVSADANYLARLIDEDTSDD